MSKRTQVFVALAVLLVGVWIYEARAPRGPGFRGRDISYWFNDSRWRDGPGLEAFRSMGSNAVPYLVAQVQREDSALVGAWSRGWQRLPVWLRRRLPQPPRPGLRQQHALALLERIGPPAQAAVPGLIAAYNRSFLKVHQLPPGRSIDWIAEFNHPALVFSGGAIPPPTMTNRYGVLIIGSPFSRPEIMLCFSELVSLARIGGANAQMVPLLLSSVRDPSLHAEYLLLSAGSESGGGLAPAARLSEPILLAALGDTNLHVRTAAATLLGALTPDRPEVIQPLLKVLDDGQPEDQDTVASRALRSNRAPPAPSVQAAAITSLAGARFQQEKIAAAMCRWLRPARGEARVQAILGLARLGGNSAEARQVILQTLASSDRVVWVGAAQALGKISADGRDPAPALAEPVRDPLQPDLEVRYRIVKAFGNLEHYSGDTVWPLVEELLLGEGASTRAQAAVALGDLGRPAQFAIPALEEALADEDVNVRESARAALEQLKKAGGKL